MLLNQKNATWYYNNFFATTEPTTIDIFKIYLRGNFTASPTTVTLPTTATPVMVHRPGATASPPSSESWSNNVVMGLREVAYSSRYGGSIALHFDLADVATPNSDQLRAEDFEYEFAQGADYRIDVRGLDMIVYVTPVATLMNPKSNVQVSGPTAVEFVPRDAIVYKLGVVVTGDEARQVLESALAAAAANVKTGLTSFQGAGLYRPPATIFAHAFLHDQFQVLIGSNDKVTKLLIADDVVDLYTEQYQAYIQATWELQYFFGQSDYPSLNNEFEFTTRTTYIDTQGQRANAGNRTWESDGHEDGPAVSIFWGAVAECRSINHSELRLSVKEFDPINDDVYDPAFVDFVLNCDAIEAKAAQPTYTGTVLYGLFGDGYTSVDGTQLSGFEDVAKGGDSDAGSLHWVATLRIVAR